MTLGDDGVSGTTFDRPAFGRMLRDIEAGHVNMVITKDLSRLGRDYILAGQYTEVYFPAKRVRYIAINDGYDSDSPYTDIAPFKNILNEMYARDTSRKIRSAFAVRMAEGAFVSPFAPYGYMRDPKDRHRLAVDEPAARVVRGIFQAAARGVTPAQIARGLNDARVPTPLQYRGSGAEDLQWSSSTITKMLRNLVYRGHMAQGKTTKPTFKSRASITNPVEDWHIVQNTHEPLVSQSLFDMAARRCGRRASGKRGAFKNVFSGLARCADCGHAMSTVGTRKKGAAANLACGTYKSRGAAACSNHFIDYDTLYELVRSAIRQTATLSECQEAEFLALARERSRNDARSAGQAEIARLRKRARELDALIEKLYEDHVQGLLDDMHMQRMLQKYEVESREVQRRMTSLSAPEDEAVAPGADLHALLHACMAPPELTPEILYGLIDHIEICQGTYVPGPHGRVKRQTVRIRFRFSGTPCAFTYTPPQGTG